MAKIYNKHNFDRALNKFLRALMTPAEEQSFLQFLRANPYFHNRAYMTTAIISNIRQYGAEKDRGIVGRATITKQQRLSKL